MSQAIRTSSNATTQPSPNRSDIVVNKASLQSLPVTEFIWGAGIECSILPYLDVDQFKWTQHNQF